MPGTGRAWARKAEGVELQETARCAGQDLDRGRTVHALRLFVALWPTPQTRRALAAAQAALPWPAGARPIGAEGLHLTLAFIGAVAPQQLGQVSRAAGVPSAGVDLALTRVDVWKGGTAVLCPAAVPAALRDLQARLAASLQAAGVPFDARDFTPHVTLARKARGMAPTDLPSLRWRSDGHVLAQSAGGRYTVLARFA
jgi:2'-5' RNA ligase